MKQFTPEEAKDEFEEWIASYSKQEKKLIDYRAFSILKIKRYYGIIR